MKKTIELYPSKIFKAEGYLIDGKKNGLWKYYYENGTKHREIIYEKGIENGEWKMWHENGNPYIEQTKLNRKTIVIWKEYYNTGRIKEVGLYSENDYSPIDFWDEEGNHLLINGNGKKIEKLGVGGIDIFEHYYENGKLTKENRI
jgi:uncharacterized protein